jgi:hypothetical protein
LSACGEGESRKSCGERDSSNHASHELSLAWTACAIEVIQV